MPRVVIDTNILYSLVGLSANNKVINSNIEDYEIAVSTPTIIESIVKYRADLPSLKLCLKPILTSKYELVSIGHAPLKNEQIEAIYKANHISQIKDTLDSILGFKIRRESEFLRFLCIGIAVGVLNILKDSEYVFEDISKNQDLLTLNTRTFIANGDFWSSEFESALKKGYANENAAKEVNHAFTTNLSALWQTLIINYYSIKCEVKLDELQSPAATKKLKLCLENDSMLKQLSLGIENPIELLAKKTNYSSIDNYLKAIDNDLRDLPSISEHTLDFLRQKMELVFKTKAKVHKNDIFDLLMVDSLGLADTLIATLDKKFLNLLKVVDFDSYSLCKTLGYT